MVHDPLDLPLLLQVPDRYPGQAPVHFQTFDEDGLADEAEGRDFFEDTIVCGLVEDDGVLCLILDLALGPLLLLCGLAATARGRCCFCLGLSDAKRHVSISSPIQMKMDQSIAVTLF